MHVQSNLRNKLEIVPTKKLELSASSNISKELIEYINTDYIAEVHAHVKFINIDHCDRDIRTDLFDQIFDKLNIKYLELNCILYKPVLSYLCQKIKESHSILILRFAEEIDIYSQLDTIETCPHIKQWKLNIINDTINEKIIQRLQNLLSERNDNSIYISKLH